MCQWWQFFPNALNYLTFNIMLALKICISSLSIWPKHDLFLRQKYLNSHCHMPSEKCKLKWIWDTATCLLQAKVLNTDNTKCWWGGGGTGTLMHAGGTAKCYSQLWKTGWQFLIKLNMLLLCDPVIVLIGIHTNDLTCLHKILHTDAYEIFFHNYCILEETKMSFIGDWVNKL